MSDWAVAGVILAVVVLLAIYAYRRGWLTRPRGSFTGLVVFHDWVNRDAQKGTKEVIHRLAGDKDEESDSGEPDFKKFLKKIKNSTNEE